eukprot:1399174-Pleurochrysis_carterae.AAC.2
MRLLQRPATREPGHTSREAFHCRCVLQQISCSMNRRKCVDNGALMHARTLAHVGGDVHVEVQETPRPVKCMRYWNKRFPFLRNADCHEMSACFVLCKSMSKKETAFTVEPNHPVEENIVQDGSDLVEAGAHANNLTFRRPLAS